MELRNKDSVGWVKVFQFEDLGQVVVIRKLNSTENGEEESISLMFRPHEICDVCEMNLEYATADAADRQFDKMDKDTVHGAVKPQFDTIEKALSDQQAG